MKFKPFPRSRPCNNTVMWQIQKKHTPGAGMVKYHLQERKYFVINRRIAVNPPVSKAIGEHKFNIGKVFLL